VGIIEKGELLAVGPVGQIVQGLHSARIIRIRFLGTNGDLKHFVEDQPHVQGCELAGDGEIRLEFSSTEDDQAALLANIVGKGFRIVGFREEEADLEDVFLKLTTGAVQ
jgi:ABC-2 type transport system ATP-binding protein